MVPPPKKLGRVTLSPSQNVKSGIFTGSRAVDSKEMYKKAWCTCKLVVLPSFSSPPHLKLPIFYDTLWSVKNRIFSGQIQLLLLIASQLFFDSSVVALFLVRKVENKSFPCTLKLGERTGQVWRDNSRRVRTHEKNSGETVRRLGTIIQSIFCAQSGAGIRLNFWKKSERVGTQGVFHRYLKTFVSPFLPTRLTAPGSSRMAQPLFSGHLYSGNTCLGLEGVPWIEVPLLCNASR